MPKTVKELRIRISPEKLGLLREFAQDKLKGMGNAETLDHLNRMCSTGEAYYDAKGWFRVYLPSLDVWLFLGKGVPKNLGGKKTKWVVEVEKNKRLNHLPAITLEFELQQKAQLQSDAEQGEAAATIIFNKKMLKTLREASPALEKMDDGRIMEYLNQNFRSITYRAVFTVRWVFLANLNIALKVGAGKRVSGIKRECGALGNKKAEVQYTLED